MKAETSRFPRPAKKKTVDETKVKQFAAGALNDLGEHELDGTASHNLSVKITPGEYALLKRWAEDENRTMAFIIRNLLRREVGAPPPKTR